MYFDDKAKEWDNDPKKIERAAIVAREIRKNIKIDSTTEALDFGSGTGLLSFHFKDDFNKIILADSSKGMTEVLISKIKAEKIDNFVPLHVDLNEEKVDFKVDLIYTLMTLHHIPDLKRILQKFKAILRPNGYFCIADLVKEDGSFHSHKADFDGHNGFDKEELIQLLSEVGFSFEYYDECYQVVKEEENQTRSYPLFLLICRT